VLGAWASDAAHQAAAWCSKWRFLSTEPEVHLTVVVDAQDTNDGSSMLVARQHHRARDDVCWILGVGDGGDQPLPSSAYACRSA
jgi:hypothetical protein